MSEGSLVQRLYSIGDGCELTIHLYGTLHLANFGQLREFDRVRTLYEKYLEVCACCRLTYDCMLNHYADAIFLSLTLQTHPLGSNMLSLRLSLKISQEHAQYLN